MGINIKLDKLRFRSKFQFSSKTIFQNDNIFTNEILIDTGCMITSISLKGRHFSDDYLMRLKERDAISFMSNGYPRVGITTGVNDRDKEKVDIGSLSVNEIVSRKDVVFTHKLNNFIVKDFNFGDIWANVSYDRSGHSLLGMSTLKDFKSVIDKNKNGDIYFSLREKRGAKEQCKYILHGLLFDKRMSLNEAYKYLSEEYSDECLYESMYELLNGHHVEDDK